MAIKAVLFDLDDTLYTSFAALNNRGFAAVGAFAEAHFGVPAADFEAAAREARLDWQRRAPGEPECHDRVLYMQGALERFGLNPMRWANTLHALYWDTLIDGMEVRPGTAALLDELRAQGIRTCVCTNMMADIQMKKLVALGLDEKLDFFVCSEEAGIDKPHGGIFELCLKKCGCEPHEAVMVGDNVEHDARGALAAGLQAVWINWTGKPDVDLGKPYHTVKDMYETAEVLRTLIQKEL